MAILLQDNFDRTASTSAVGSPQVGPDPIIEAGTWGIINNTLYTSALVSGISRISWDVGTPNVEVSIVRTGTMTSGALLIAGDGSTWYRLLIQSTMIEVAWATAALTVPITYWRTPTIALGQKYTVKYNAGIMDVLIDDVSLGPTALSMMPFLAGTRVGLTTSSMAVRFDNLLASDSSPFNMNRSGQSYKGRKTATQDQGAAA